MISKVKIFQTEDGQFCVAKTNGYRSFTLAEFATPDEAAAFRDYYLSPKTNVSFYLPLALLALIDKERVGTRLSRSDVVVRLLEDHFGLKTGI